VFDYDGVPFLSQGLSDSLLVFALARIATGLCGGSVPIVESYIADSIPEAARGQYFAILGSVITLAFMVG